MLCSPEKLVLTLLIVVLASCGGGGGGDEPSKAIQAIEFSDSSEINLHVDDQYTNPVIDGDGYGRIPR